MPVASFGAPGTTRLPDEVVLMRIELDGWIETPAWPAGVSLRTFRPEDASAVHRLLVDAFAGAPEEILPFGEWHETMTTDPQFDPAAWFLAEEDGALVGAALAWNDGFLEGPRGTPRGSPARNRRGASPARFLRVRRTRRSIGCRSRCSRPTTTPAVSTSGSA